MTKSKVFTTVLYDDKELKDREIEQNERLIDEFDKGIERYTKQNEELDKITKQVIIILSIVSYCTDIHIGSRFSLCLMIRSKNNFCLTRNPHWTIAGTPFSMHTLEGQPQLHRPVQRDKPEVQ